MDAPFPQQQPAGSALSEAPSPPTVLARKERQVAWWRLVAAAFELDDAAPSLQSMVGEMAHARDLPSSLLDTGTSIPVLLHRYASLKPHFDALAGLNAAPESLAENAPGVPRADDTVAARDGDEPRAQDENERDTPPVRHDLPGIEDDDIDLTRTLVFSKLLLNVFGPSTRGGTCSAAQYAQWCDDVAALEASLGFAGGALRPTSEQSSGGHTMMGQSGNVQRIDDARLREELVAMESDLIQRMDLRQVLQDDRLAARLSPTMSLVEQLLYDKSNLSGAAMKNAKMLIQKYVDELASVLKKQVFSSRSGEIDRSIPPLRIFRNLDLKRTIWKNLPNYDPRDGKLYVQQLFYRQTSQKSMNKYLIVVVDQSGSMVSAMVQCAILASIFATLPRVEVSLVAFDTNVIDLTPWVRDPLESLLRTNLGGGNDGPKAMEVARELVVDARRTTMVWISDFYERRELFPMIKSVKESGVHFIPVGSVSGSGYYSVDAWYKEQLKAIGLPMLTGNIKNLIGELKKQLT